MVKAKQYAAVDIAKYVSALLVVAIHTYPFLEISETFNTLFIAIVCRLAVPFFFVSSGYFLFRKLNGTKKQNLNRLKKYLWRLISLYLVWTVIYIPYTIWNYMSEGFFSDQPGRLDSGLLPEWFLLPSLVFARFNYRNSDCLSDWRKEKNFQSGFYFDDSLLHRLSY